MLADRWGVTDAEVARQFPCDDIVPSPAMAAWRAVSVAAEPAAVWPWVAQIRLAPYSYDWLDNLGRRSPQQLVPADDPVVGEAFTRAFGRPQGEIVSVDVGKQLTGRILGAVLSYVLRPSDGGTRLLLKIVLGGGRAVAPLVSVGDLVMARRQLLNLKRLAETGRPDDVKP